MIMLTRIVSASSSMLENAVSTLLDSEYFASRLTLATTLRQKSKRSVKYTTIMWTVYVYGGRRGLAELSIPELSNASV
jgi:hypothetical protein